MPFGSREFVKFIHVDHTVACQIKLDKHLGQLAFAFRRRVSLARAGRRRHFDGTHSGGSGIKLQQVLRFGSFGEHLGVEIDEHPEQPKITQTHHDLRTR